MCSNKHKTTFDLFDNYSFTDNRYYPEQQQNNNRMNKPNNYNTPFYRDSDEGSPTDIKFINSSSSINSIFDTPGPTPSFAQTTTITPVISRNDIKPLTELEFSSIISNKLTQHQSQQSQQEKLVIILVGLPASGKSTTCHQLKQFINKTTPYKPEVFNAGDVRRRNSISFNDSDFFSPNNQEGKEARELYATITVNSLIQSLNSNIIDVGFLDATNTTLERRQRMMKTIKQEAIGNVKIVIFDIQCNDSRLLNFNINEKADNNDYKGKEYKSAIEDFKKRTQHYYKVYQPILEQELNNQPSLAMYMKVVNAGESFEFNHVDPKFKQNSHWFKILSEFKDSYYETEGKRYLDLVNKWYEKR